MPTRAPALGSGLDVLRVLASVTGPVPASTIARRLGLPRSSTYHLLGVLCQAGFVAHYPEERAYALGVATFEIGTAYLRQDRLERLGRPVLARLVSSTRSTAHLGILLGRELLYLLKEEPARPVPLVTDVGLRLPAHLTASGRALLAALPRTEFDAIYPPGAPLVDRTGRGPRTVAGLHRVIADELAAGVSTEDGYVTAGIASVAVASRDHTGRPVAAISVSVPAAVLSARRPALVAAVTRSAATLTRRLSGR
jgi:DNA-binding IclR family transcriptional regulator